MSALGVAAALFVACAVGVFTWLNRAAKAPLYEAPPVGKSVTVYARATYGQHDEVWHEVTHEYDTIPTPAAMVGVLVWLIRDRGFTFMAADLACDALYEAIIEQEMADLDGELLALGGVS